MNHGVLYHNEDIPSSVSTPLPRPIKERISFVIETFTTCILNLIKFSF